jgi:hypothetical protein
MQKSEDINRDIERRKAIADIIKEFNGESHGHTLERLASEIIRLRYGCRKLSQGLAEIEAGKIFAIIGQGPHGPANYAREYNRDVASGYHDELLKLVEMFK